MRVLAFGTYDVAAHPRVAVLLEGLRAHGLEVDECNQPLGVTTMGRVALLGQPWRLPGLLLLIARRWIELIRRARRLPRPDVVLVGYLGHFDVLLARRLFPRTPVALDLLVSGAETALDRGLGGALVARLLRWLDRRAIGAADIVIVDTEEHRQLVPAQRHAETVVAAVGASAEWFTAGAQAASQREAAAPAGWDSARRPLRVVFFGLFTPLQGGPVIGQAIRLLSGEPIEITMIGHGQDLAATKEAAGGNPNVTWTPWVPASSLPQVVADHDVCLGIFGTGSKAHRVVPTKVFQGLAAGAVVVTSDTPPQRRVLSSAAVLTPAGDAEALAAVLRELARDPERVRDLRRESARAAPDIAGASTVTRELAASLAHPSGLLDRRRR